VFEKHRKDSEAPPFPEVFAGHMLNADPPDHDRLRKLVTKAFTARRVAEMRPRIEEITTSLLDKIVPGSEVDLLDAFAFPLPITVICELLGIPDDDRDDFRQWSNTLVGNAQPEELQHASTAMAEYLIKMIEYKRANPGDDMLSALVDASEDGDRLDPQELIAMVFLLLVAGHETTVNLIGNGMLNLLRHPGQLAALRADRSLLSGAIEEFLRFEGPVITSTFRFTTEPVEVDGVTIPEDEVVLLGLGSANRDEGRFAHADQFDITRDPGGHLAFGHGIHYCLGAPLARLEAEIAFTGLLDRFEQIELTVPSDELRYRVSTLMHGLMTLPVRLG
jgi:cytochrome P450